MPTIDLDGSGNVFADVQRLPAEGSSLENVLIQLPPYRFSVPAELMPAGFEIVIAKRLHHDLSNVIRSFLGLLATEAEKKSLRVDIPASIEEVEARQISANDASMKETTNG